MKYHADDVDEKHMLRLRYIKLRGEKLSGSPIIWTCRQEDERYLIITETYVGKDEPYRVDRTGGDIGRLEMFEHLFCEKWGFSHLGGY